MRANPQANLGLRCTLLVVSSSRLSSPFDYRNWNSLAIPSALPCILRTHCALRRRLQILVEKRFFLLFWVCFAERSSSRRFWNDFLCFPCGVYKGSIHHDVCRTCQRAQRGRGNSVRSPDSTMGCRCTEEVLPRAWRTQRLLLLGKSMGVCLIIIFLAKPL